MKYLLLVFVLVACTTAEPVKEAPKKKPNVCVEDPESDLAKLLCK